MKAFRKRWLGLLAVFIIPMSANAHFYCVTTASDLHAALTDASTPTSSGGHNGEQNTIALVANVYFADTTFSYSSTSTSGYLIMEGGFPPNCSGPIVENAFETVLDGEHNKPVLRLNGNAEIAVYNLTVQNGSTSEVGGGMSINYVPGYKSTVLVQQCVIRTNHSNFNGGGLAVGADGSGVILTIANNLIYGNSADGQYGAGAIFHSSGAVVSFYSNTVVGNAASQAPNNGGVMFDLPGFTSLQNNIVYDNAGSDLYINGNNASLGHNDYHVLAGLSPAMSFGNQTVSPQFVSTANQDYRLLGTSPLLGASPESGVHAATDIVGHSYPGGGFVDLGAYEETIFRHGFDPPPI